MLHRARRVTICLDGWTKRGLSASYLAISACFFDPSTHRPIHATLNVYEMQHPHTGQVIADCLERCMQQWGIGHEKVLLIVSDSGSNMIKAIKLLQARCEVERNNQVEDGERENDGEVDEDEENGEQEIEVAMELPPHVVYRRMACLAHTLQLVIKAAYVHFDTLLCKTRHLVGRIRKSSVAVEKLVGMCGKSVISDCTTRWNSTFQMVSRLLGLKTEVNAVLAEIGMTIL